MAIERKKTHTYAAPPTIVEKARKKAEKEGVTLSEKICDWVNEYVTPISKRGYMTVAEANEKIKQRQFK